jgi:hypothetical protein
MEEITDKRGKVKWGVGKKSKETDHNATPADLYKVLNDEFSTYIFQFISFQ